MWPEEAAKPVFSCSHQVYPDTGYINYDQLEENASLFHPKLIIAGEWHVGRSLVPGQGLCLLQRRMESYPILQLTAELAA